MPVVIFFFSLFALSVIVGIVKTVLQHKRQNERERQEYQRYLDQKNRQEHERRLREEQRLSRERYAREEEARKKTQKEREEQARREELERARATDPHRIFIEEQRRLMSASLRYDILRRDNFRCQICGVTAKDGYKLHVDHIVPVSKGGLTEPSNLRTLCERCNMGKGAKIE